MLIDIFYKLNYTHIMYANNPIEYTVNYFDFFFVVHLIFALKPHLKNT